MNRAWNLNVWLFPVVCVRTVLSILFRPKTDSDRVENFAQLFNSRDLDSKEMFAWKEPEVCRISNFTAVFKLFDQKKFCFNFSEFSFYFLYTNISKNLWKFEKMSIYIVSEEFFQASQLFWLSYTFQMSNMFGCVDTKPHTKYARVGLLYIWQQLERSNCRKIWTHIRP